MERERIETQLLERTFQEIKKITGMSNIKRIVEKVTNKDKDYNLCVAKVSDGENKLNLIKEKIKRLEDEFTELKNTASFDISESNKKMQNEYLHKDAQDLIEKEIKMKEELEEMREKNENVELIYEKVIDNLKNLIQYKHDDENYYDGSSSQRNLVIEDDLISQYSNFLSKMANNAKSSYNEVYSN